MRDSRVSSDEGIHTKRSMPSCSSLPKIWSPEMDRYIVRLVILNKVRPHHLAKVVKNHFPELEYVSILLPPCHEACLVLAHNARKQSDSLLSMPSQRLLSPTASGGSMRRTTTIIL